MRQTAHSDQPRCQLAELFDRIYVLNLPDRTDRRDEMLHELQLAAFPAPGEKLRFFRATRFTEAGPFPSVGSRGCYMSHLAVLREALREGLSTVLILEDDLQFSPLVLRHDRLLAEKLHDLTWDMLYLGHVLPGRPTAEAVAFRPCDEPIVTAHFYAVHKRIIADLVAFLEQILERPPGGAEPGPMHVDGAFSTFRQMHPQVVTLVAEPSLGGQRPSRSDIAAPRWFDRTPLLREGAAAFRRLRTRQSRRARQTAC
jgi:glycosyl transferase family 25